MASLKELLAKNKNNGNGDDNKNMPKINEPKVDPFAALRDKVKPKVQSDNKETKLLENTKPQEESKEEITFSPEKGVQIKDPRKEEVKFKVSSQNILDYYSQVDTVNKEVVEKFSTNLALLADNLKNKDIVGDALAKTMRTIQEHPFLADILREEDCGLMVSSLRESYGVTIAKKQGKTQKKKEKAEAVKKIESELGDFEIKI